MCEDKTWIKCNSRFAAYEKCIVDMDAQESMGGTICCDTAEVSMLRKLRKVEGIVNHEY